MNNAVVTGSCDESALATEYEIAYAVASEEEGAPLVEVIEYAVTVDAEPDVMTLTDGEQGPPGASAFSDWLKRNPGGTWEQFMSELGSGAIWSSKEW